MSDEEEILEEGKEGAEQAATENDPLATLQAERDQYLVGWKRALADYDNVKKELSTEKDRMRASVQWSFAGALLPVLDNFDEATKHAPEGLDPKTQNWLTGILYIKNQFEQVMNDLGLQPFGAVGDAFDPNKHEAAGEREEEGKEHGTILEIVRRGWTLGERVVRPASVITAK